MLASRLEGKSCVVTAAASGIGRAIALALLENGGDVTATDIDSVGLTQLKEAYPRLNCQQLDVCDPEAVAALADHRFDVLVNVAGMVHSGTILDWTRADWHHATDLNIVSAISTIRACLPGMLIRRAGSIINISSVASSVRGVPNRFIYATTKAALIGLTKAVAADFVAQGIRCNAIAPGTIDTPSLHDRLHATGDFDAAHKAFIARQPMGRLGTTSEVAALAVYLASDESAFTTGAVHIIDGGWTM